MICHLTPQREGGYPFSGFGIRFQTENTDRTGIIGRCGEVDYEASWKQILPFLRGFALIVDENIGKRGSCVTNKGTFFEGKEQAAYPTIDGFGVILGIRLSLFIEILKSGVYRCVVSFIVNQEERDIGQQGPSGLIVPVVAGPFHPIEQISQYAGIFFYHKQHGSAARTDSEIIGYKSVEISIVASVGDVVGADGRIRIDQTHPDMTDFPDIHLSWRHGLVTEKGLIHPHLGLASEVLVHSCQNNDEFVTGIGRFADQTTIVGGLSLLDMPDDKSSTVPGTIAAWFLKQAQYLVGHVIQRLSGNWGPIALKQLPVSGPISPPLFFLSI